jgi:hypothetical protein
VTAFDTVSQSASRRGYFWVSLAAGLVVAGGAVAVTNQGAGEPRAATQANAPAAPQGTGTAAPGSANGNGNGNTEKGKSFTISGSATGLYPGAMRPLALTVNNPDPQAIRVESITVQAANASPQCAGSVLSVGSFTPFVVDGRATGTTTLSLSMAATAGNACRSATWTLTYTGSAVKA